MICPASLRTSAMNSHMTITQGIHRLESKIAWSFFNGEESHARDM